MEFLQESIAGISRYIITHLHKNISDLLNKLDQKGSQISEKDKALAVILLVDDICSGRSYDNLQKKEILKMISEKHGWIKSYMSTSRTEISKLANEELLFHKRNMNISSHTFYKTLDVFPPRPNYNLEKELIEKLQRINNKKWGNQWPPLSLVIRNPLPNINPVSMKKYAESICGVERRGVINSLQIIIGSSFFLEKQQKIMAIPSRTVYSSLLDICCDLINLNTKNPRKFISLEDFTKWQYTDTGAKKTLCYKFVRHLAYEKIYRTICAGGDHIIRIDDPNVSGLSNLLVRLGNQLENASIKFIAAPVSEISLNTINSNNSKFFLYRGIKISPTELSTVKLLYFGLNHQVINKNNSARGPGGLCNGTIGVDLQYVNNLSIIECYKAVHAIHVKYDPNIPEYVEQKFVKEWKATIDVERISKEIIEKTWKERAAGIEPSENQQLHMICACPGTGKSTYMEKIMRQDPNTFTIEPDYFVYNTPINNKTCKEKRNELHQMIYAELDNIDFLKNHAYFAGIYKNTMKLLSRPLFVDPFRPLSLAISYGLWSKAIASGISVCYESASINRDLINAVPDNKTLHITLINLPFMKTFNQQMKRSLTADRHSSFYRLRAFYTKLFNDFNNFYSIPENKLKYPLSVASYTDSYDFSQMKLSIQESEDLNVIPYDPDDSPQLMNFLYKFTGNIIYKRSGVSEPAKIVFGSGVSNPVCIIILMIIALIVFILNPDDIFQLNQLIHREY